MVGHLSITPTGFKSYNVLVFLREMAMHAFENNRRAFTRRYTLLPLLSVRRLQICGQYYSENRTTNQDKPCLYDKLGHIDIIEGLLLFGTPAMRHSEEPLRIYGFTLVDLAHPCVEWSPIYVNG